MSPLAVAWLVAFPGCERVLRTEGPPAPNTLPPITAEAMARVPAPEGTVTVAHVAEWPLDRVPPVPGCTVEYLPVRTSYALMNVVHRSPVDVVLAPTDVSRRLMRDDILQPLPTHAIDGWSSVDAALREGPWNVFEGRPFGVPVQWGPQGLLTRSDAFLEPPRSWQILYEAFQLADGPPNRGRIQAYEAPIALAQAALYLKTAEPELGIADPFSLTKPQFRAALRATRQQRALTDRYWTDSQQLVDGVQSGRVVAADARYAAVRALRASGLEVDFGVPDEGATAWAVTGLLHRDAPHPGCGVRVLASLLDPTVQAALADAWASVPTRTDVCATLPDDQCREHGADTRDRLVFWRTPERHCDGETPCVAHHEWISQHTLARGGL